MQPTVGYNDECEIRTRPEVIHVLAAAAAASGEHIPSGLHGHPNVSALIRKRGGGTVVNIKKPRVAPANSTLARILLLQSERCGTTPGQVFDELFEVVKLETRAAGDAA